MGCSGGRADVSTSTTGSAPPQPSASPPLSPARRGAFHALPPQQVMLLGILLVEIIAFGVSAENFLTLDNFFLIPRHNVELGLVALALTPVILTGGIDLSVGSLLGLSAVLFGKMWRDLGLP